MKIPVCSVATKKSLDEFLLLKFSFEQYHEAEWYVSTDDHSSKVLSEYDNVNVFNLVKTDDCSHGVNDPVKNRLFLELIMTKFNVMEAAIEDHGVGLFLDSDIFFTNSLETRFIDLLFNDNIDAILSPHMTNNLELETQVGHYNVGFWATRNKDYLHAHRDMSWQHKELGLYYEQQPLQFTSYDFLSVNSPIYYNIGWWRFNEEYTRSRLSWLGIHDDVLMLKNHPAVCFHAHTLKDLDYENFGNFMVGYVLDLMSKCDNKKYELFTKKLIDLRSHSG